MNKKAMLVVGMGTMGAGIAQICAQVGHLVKVSDSDGKMIEKGLKDIAWSLGKMEEQGKLKEPKEAILSRIQSIQDLHDANGTEFIIEAIFENLQAKQDLFKMLSEICDRKTIFATNTSSLSITEIASAVPSPERVIGIHFFNPVHRMKLVEIVRGISTADEAVHSAIDIVQSLGKEPVIVSRDTAGFIVNRINGMAFLEALRLLEKGVATVEDIDKAIRLGLGYPLGPFELMDLIGLDIVLNARLGIYDESRDPNHYPPVTLRRMVKAGHLGRKTGKGFYEYSK